MMKQYRNWISLLLAGLLLLSLPACGDGGGKDPEVTKLTLASFARLDRTKKQLQNAVDQFNAGHPDIQIELQDYGGEDYQIVRQNRERLLTEMTAGRGPDIIDLGHGGLPLEQLARRGYLEELWPYIESDPELGRESLLEGPLKAAEISGGLYTAFDSVMIYTLVGSRDVVGDRLGWTLADVQEAFAAMPEGSTVMEFFTTRSDLLDYLLSMCLNDYVDWETGQCNFDCAGFRNAMEFIASFPEQVAGIDRSAVDAAMWQSIIQEQVWRMEEGLQMLSMAVLCGPDDVQTYDRSWNGASFVGYPVGEGDTGSAFDLPETTLVMSAGCKNKEAAWEFIRQWFLPKYASEGAAANASSIPINLSDYNLIKKAFMLESTMASVTDMHPVTEEEMQRFEDLLNSINRTSEYDRDLFYIVREVSGPYLSGDKDLDETISQLQSRAKLYVSEQM